MIRLAYYARPLNVFGTPQERRDERLIHQAGLSVVNINTPEIQEQYEREGMSIFRPIVRACDALFFRAFMDGSIPAGVMKEIKWAREKGLPVFELPRMVYSRGLSVDDTKCALIEMGER